MCTVLLLGFVYFEGQRRQIPSVASARASVETQWINFTQAKLEPHSVDYLDQRDPVFFFLNLDLHQFLLTHRYQPLEYACFCMRIHALFPEKVMKMLEGKWNSWIRPFSLDLHRKLMGSILSWDSSFWWKLVQKFLCNPADKPADKQSNKWTRTKTKHCWGR